MVARRLLSSSLLLLLGVATASAGVNHWTPLGPYGLFGGVTISGLAVQPGAVFVTTEQGVYRSRDAGAHWELVLETAPHGLTSIAADPSRPGVVYAGGLGAVYRTDDSGNSWVAFDLPEEQWVQALAADPQSPGVLWAGTAGTASGPGGLLRSPDGGESWDEMLALVGDHSSITSIAIEPGNGSTLYAGTNGQQLWRTRDGGLHWSALSPAVPGPIRAIAIDPAEPTRIYVLSNPEVCAGFCFPGVMLRSENGGDTFSSIGPPGYPAFFFWGIVVAPDSTLYVGSGDRVWRSLDHGGTFTPVEAQTEIFADHLALDSLSRLYAGTYEGAFRLDIVTDVLALQDGRFEVTVVRHTSPTGPDFPAQAVPVSRQAGYFWFFDPENVEVMVKVLDGTFINGHYWVFYASLSSVPYTVTVTDTASGETKTYENAAGQLASVADTSAFRSFPFPGTVAPAAAHRSGPAARATAPAWTPIGIDPERGVYAIALDPQHPHIFAGAGGVDHTIFKSYDGGSSWVTLVTLPELPTEIRVDLHVPDIIYALTASHLYRSTDAGGTWPAIAPGLGATSLAFDSLEAGTVYAGTPNGFFVSTDHGDAWAVRGAELSGKPVGPIATTSSGRFYAVADGKDLWASDDSGLSWTLMHAFPNGGLQSLVSSSRNSSTVYVSESCCGGVGTGSTPPTAVPVWKSEDGGATWTEVLLTPGGANAIVLDRSDPSVVYLGGYAGVLRSANGGGSWTLMNQGLSGQVFTLALSGNAELYAGTNAGGGVFRLDLDDLPGSCQADDHTLCLQDGRFQVRVAWQRTPLGPTLQAPAAALTGDTGYFWFLDDGNVELVVKVLDGRPVNGHFWVFYGALTNLAYTITVTDTQTGDVRTYENPRGKLASVADTAAF